MALTNLSHVNEQIQKFWAPIGAKQLRAKLLLGSLVNREYEGSLKAQGDTVKISQINAATGELKATSVNTFTPETLSVSNSTITADQLAIASFEFSDLAVLQSQIEGDNPQIRDALVYGVQAKIDGYLKSLIAPSASSPDHVLNSIATMDAAQLRAIRTLAAKAKWMKEKGWYGLLDPTYYGQLLADSVVASSLNNGGSDAPSVAGQIAKAAYGFNLLEDDGMADKTSTFFHPDFMNLVMQQDMTFKISDTHPQGKLGFIISAHVVFGAKLGIDGAKKHITAVGAAEV